MVFTRVSTTISPALGQIPAPFWALPMDSLQPLPPGSLPGLPKTCEASLLLSRRPLCRCPGRLGWKPGAPPPCSQANACYCSKRGSKLPVGLGAVMIKTGYCSRGC